MDSDEAENHDNSGSPNCPAKSAYFSSGRYDPDFEVPDFEYPDNSDDDLGESGYDSYGTETTTATSSNNDSPESTLVNSEYETERMVIPTQGGFDDHASDDGLSELESNLDCMTDGSDADESEDSDDASTIVAAEANKKKVDKEYEVLATSDDFFEREYRDHQWSAGAHELLPSYLLLNNTSSTEQFRPLEPYEDLLTDCSDTSDDEDDRDTDPETFSQWRERTNRDWTIQVPMRDLQSAMDIEKRYLAGKINLEPRRTSIGTKMGIADRVERGRRKEWAKQTARRFPGRYVPYPGRPVRQPPSVSAAEKARRERRKK